MAKTGLFGTGARVSPLEQSRIQPTGIPGSTFVRAPVREAGGNAQALAQALGGLNSALLNYGNVQAKQEEDPQSRANREWIAKRQQMSIEDLRREASEGTHDGMRVREDALNALLGERANDDFRKRWIEFYNTEFDRTKGDAASEYERLRQEYAAGLPSEIARGNFYRLTGDHYRAWMEKDTEEKVAYVKQEVNTTIVDGFRNTLDDALNIHGKTAQEAAGIVFTKSASNRDFLGLSGQEQNDTIFRIAEEFALQGNEEVARALLEGGRTGADGKTVPPLVKIAGYTDKALKLLEQAGNKRDQKVREDGLNSFMEDDDLILRGAFTASEAERRKGSGLYNDAQLATMVDQSNRNRMAIENKAATEQQKRALRQHHELEKRRVYSQAYSAMDNLGGINRLRDIEIPSSSGEGTTTLSKQSIVDEVVDMKEEDFSEHQETLIANGMDPAAAREATNRMRIDWYAGNGIDNEEWANTLNGMGGRATIDTLLQKGEVPEYLKSSADLYRQLKAVNPAYLSTLLTDKYSKEFFDTYDMAVTQRRMPTEDAMLYAAQWSAQPENVKARSMVSIPDADKIAKTTLRSLGVDERFANHAYVMERIASMSRHGATEREIKSSLEKDILETSVPVNGMLVFAHSDLPPDFPDLMQLELQTRFEELGKRYGIEDVSDLYVVADGADSKWVVMSKANRMPVGSAPITARSLEEHRQKREAQREGKIRELAKAKDADRARLKQEYDADIAAQRKQIEYWRSKATSRRNVSKSLADGIANRLQQNLDERLARDSGVISDEAKSLEKSIKDGQVRADEHTKATRDWLKSLVPQVRIGSRTFFDN